MLTNLLLKTSFLKSEGDLYYKVYCRGERGFTLHEENLSNAAQLELLITVQNQLL